ncbi:MAG: DNA replication and repair protein RecF [Pseudomonadota bacterium]
MRIRTLRAVGWRNLAPLALDLHPGGGLTVLYGDNGQGKTNVVEAIHYLATFRSFRTTRAADLVQVGATDARVGIDVETKDLVRSVEVRLLLGESRPDPGGGAAAARTATRTIRLDSKPVRGVAPAFGVVSVVLFVPEDLLLIRAAPAARRRFLDMAISGVEPAYFGEAAAFQRILRTRNAVLRAHRPPGGSGVLLDTYDEQLAQAGARVVSRRRQLVTALLPDVERTFRALHADLPVALRYESDASVSGMVAEEDVQSALRAGLRRRRGVDERRGHTTFGPHTDDLEILLSGRPAREHASQGQMRSLVLAMKLAELAHVEERRGETPVLLLDDVPSELDPTRRRYLFETLGRLPCQTLVSVADPAVVPAVAGRVDFRVEAGHLKGVPIFPLQTDP